MSRLPRFSRFRRLSSKLTFSYALVTVATLLFAELCVGGVIGLLVNRAELVPRVLSFLVTGAAQDLLPSLESSPPNLDGIHGWMSRLDHGGVPFEAYGQRINFVLDANTFANSTFYVLDPRGNLWFRFPEQESMQPGLPFSIPDVPGLDAIVLEARNGERDSGRLYLATEEPALLAIVAPITDPDGDFRGVLVMVVRNMTVVNTLGQLPALLGSSLICLGPVAILVGLVFGFLTARGLSRRLGRMALTASAWGRGDFSTTIQDSSPDEIGQLAVELNRMSEQMQDLIRTRQQLAGMEERNRLARDLHDSVKQQVFAINMNLGTAQTLWKRDPEKAGEHLESAMQLARQAQKELAALIQTLRPVQLQGKGLVQALQEFLTDWQAHSGINVDFQAGEGITLSDEKEQALFRVAQEALANAARHSGATKVEVALEMRRDRILLTISDNGHGFDPAQDTRGYGLKSMAERLQAHGGILNIASDETGTKLTAEMPR
jgi:NarL family two-component system sensor histidine kinase LiaS